MPSSGATIRLDSAPGNVALSMESNNEVLENLEKDPILIKYGITIDIGRVHNVNKNPVAENAVKEFLKERLRLNPEGGPVTEIEKSLITRNMNQRIRNRGLAAKEMLLRRELVENKPKDILDDELSETQNKKRVAAQSINEQTKATFKRLPAPIPVKLGDNIFIKSDLTKLRGREQYKVVDVVKDKTTMIG